MQMLNSISGQRRGYRFLVVDDSIFARKNISKEVEALSIIRQGDSEAKVVIVSALGHDGLVRKSIALGAKHFIVKPIELEKAAAVIQFVLEQGGRNDEV